MLFKSIEPNTWYKVREVAKITGWSTDVVYDWVHRGKLQAFVHPGRSDKRKRVFKALRILGSELIRFITENLTPRK